MRRFIRGSFRRVVSILLLMTLVAGVVGLPVLSLPAAKSGRFPCENSPCGCATAESCWDHCCCHSDGEKLAWAAEHGVQPPAFLVARVAVSGHPLVVATHNAAPHAAEASCCLVSKKCELASDRQAVSDKHDPDSDSVSALQIVRLEDAANCRGMTRIWTLLSRIVVHQAPLLLTHEEPRFLHCLAIENVRAVSRTFCPDPPIP